jgi:hypothetical protein
MPRQLSGSRPSVETAGAQEGDGIDKVDDKVTDKEHCRSCNAPGLWLRWRLQFMTESYIQELFAERIGGRQYGNGSNPFGERLGAKTGFGG